MIFFILIPALLALLLAMALPSALKRHSVYRVFTGMILSFLGVVLPIFVFVMSGFLLPEWKGACLHGWIDCFIVGKLALAPMVLVGAAAWYRIEVLGITGVHLDTVLSFGSKDHPSDGCDGLHRARRGYADPLLTRTDHSV